MPTTTKDTQVQPRNVYMLGHFADDTTVSLIVQENGLEVHPVEVEHVSEIDSFMDDIDAMNRADIFLVSLDSASDPAKLFTSVLDVAKRGSGLSARTFEIFRTRLAAVDVMDSEIAWKCGWAYAMNKILVTFSASGAKPPMPGSVVAHITDLKQLAEVCTQLSNVEGDEVQQAKALGELRAKYGVGKG